MLHPTLTAKATDQVFVRHSADGSPQVRTMAVPSRGRIDAGVVLYIEGTATDRADWLRRAAAVFVEAAGRLDDGGLGGSGQAGGMSPAPAARRCGASIAMHSPGGGNA